MKIVEGILEAQGTIHEYVRCEHCNSDTEWQDCYDCEDGASYHDCGEDTCCCLDPTPNVICDTCEGKSGWRVCLSCNDDKEVS